MKNIVFIPGTLCDKDLFQSQLEFFSDYNCVVADHTSSGDLSTVSSDILDSVDGPAIIIGLSYGGIIAMEMMRQNPNLIQGLVLLNTNHRLPSESTRANQERLVGMAVLGRLESVTNDILLDAMLHPDHARSETMRKRVLDMTINIGVDGFVNQIKSQLGRPDSREDLSDYKCPVLLITGQEDKVCTPEIYRDMQQLIPNSELFIINNCGHLSTMEKPEEINQVLQKWISENFN